MSDLPPKPGALPRPRKRFGQHFLKDRSVLTRIADAVGASSGDTVIEIGPGRGALTDVLADRATRLLAIELDRDLAGHLRERYASRPHVTIVEGDVLETDLAALAGGDFVLAGNVPYYITTPILFHALQAPRPRRAVYLVQKEVAERAAAAPGGKEYGALSVNVQAVAHVEILFRVPPGAFQPPPQVDSAVIRVTPRPDPVVRARRGKAVPPHRAGGIRTPTEAAAPRGTDDRAAGCGGGRRGARGGGDRSRGAAGDPLARGVRAARARDAGLTGRPARRCARFRACRVPSSFPRISTGVPRAVTRGAERVPQNLIRFVPA